MSIDWETQVEDEKADRVDEGKGWRRVTPHHGARWYEDCAPADDTWPETDIKFTSVTEALRAGVPTDFTGPTKWNQARWTWEHRAELFSRPQDEMIQAMVESSSISLEQAANRGSAGHRYIEARLGGDIPDWDDIEANEAGPWVAGIEQFLSDIQPETVMLESVCFDRTNQVAGTFDALLRWDGQTVLVDWKTRASKHDRRPKEAIQLGAYITMLTEHYFMDDRGRRRQFHPIDGAVVVTFAPDGTWAPQWVDVGAAKAAYETALAMRLANRTSHLFDKTVKPSQPFDPNVVLAEAIANVPEGSPEHRQLANAWVTAGLGAPSQGQVPPERFGEAMALIHRFAGRFQPFPQVKEEPLCVKPDVQNDLLIRLRNLPLDIRQQVLDHGTGLGALDSSTLLVADAEDWDRHIAAGEEKARLRIAEICDVQVLLDQVGGVEAQTAVLRPLPDPVVWTERDLTIAAACWKALDEDLITVLGDELRVDIENAMHVAAVEDGGKRALIKIAKQKAQELGLTKPSKWDDLMADPVLYAAVVAA